MFAAGVDLGGTHFAAGIVDRSGRILAKISRPTLAERPFAIIVRDIAETVSLAAKQAGITTGEIAGTGFGVPSTINPKTNKLIFANNLSWLNEDLCGEYGKYIPGPVFMDNDAGCAALGEVLTDPRPPESALMLTFGTGFGGGVIMNGKIFRGCDGFGIEPGHTVIVYGGRECNCGNRGCVEAYTSITALVTQCKEKMLLHPESLMWETCVDSAGARDIDMAGGRTAFTAARKGDRAALDLIEEFTAMAGQAAANLITLFRPEKVIIGGGLCNEGDYFIGPLYEAAAKRVFGGGLMPMPPFSKARLGNDAGIAGAALLVFGSRK